MQPRPLVANARRSGLGSLRAVVPRTKRSPLGSSSERPPVSVASLARAVAPTVFGALFAVGTAHGHLPFPLDVNLPFLLAMAVLLTSAILVVRTPTCGSEASFKRPKRLWSLKRARTAVVGT